MPKTHLQIIEALETRLLKALVNNDLEAMSEMLHPEIVMSNETGQVFKGRANMPLLQTSLMVRTTEITERSISFFNNVAVVNSLEKRSGTYHDMLYEREYRIMRIWKFEGRKWKVIAGAVILL